MTVRGKKNSFQKHMKNILLNEEVMLTASSKEELQQKMQRQEQKWEKQIALLVDKLEAQARTQEAQAVHTALRHLLKDEVHKGIKPDWQSEDSISRPFPPFIFDLAPKYETYEQLFPLPGINPFVAVFMPGVRRNRQEMLDRAQQLYQQACVEYEAQRSKAFEGYQSLWEGYQRGDAEAIQWVLECILDNLDFPCQYGSQHVVKFEHEDREAVINMLLPHVNDLPTVREYRYVSTRKVVEPVVMRTTEIQDFYDDLLAQITLATLYRLFHDAPTIQLQSVIFNGYVEGIHPATGHKQKHCILTVEARRKEFQKLNLKKVTPLACVQNLKGLLLKPLTDLVPVEPIRRVFNMDDERFIETKDTLARSASMVDLATMPWEVFEHLVAQLFEKIYKDLGGEVRLTRRSADMGVDIVVFYPDPLHGGTIVIQVKHYSTTKVQPSHIRELAGTMDWERATRGIMVTTGKYSDGVREQANKHNISVIGAQELLSLLHKHGFTQFCLSR